MRPILEAATCAAATLVFALAATSASAAHAPQSPALAGGQSFSDELPPAVLAHAIGPGPARFVDRRPLRSERRVVLRGRVDRGVECYILRTPRGDIWSLVGEAGLAPGQRVIVKGRLAEVSTCMQGRGTIQVERMHVLKRKKPAKRG